MEALREELDQSRRELQRVQARERTHRGDGELKIAELANTARMLAGKSDAHAVAAAARQDLLAEQLTVHHLRADVEAYRSLLDAEQARITALKRDLETAKSLLDAAGVAETIQHVPGVSAQKVIETFAGKLFKLEHQLAASQSECAKLKLKIGDGFATSEPSRQLSSPSGRDARLSGLFAGSSRGPNPGKPKRGRSASPSATRRQPRPSSAEAERGARAGSLSGAESRVRANLGIGGEEDSDGEVWAPPALRMPAAAAAAGDPSGGAAPGDAAHIWEALAPCVQSQGRSSESVVESLNSALMARRLVLQADQIRDLEGKVEALERERTEILAERLRQEVDENDRTRIDLDTCSRRLELSESTQRLALEDLRRARERILALEKEAVQARLFGQPEPASAAVGVDRAPGKSGRFYEYMSDSDEEAGEDESPQDTDRSSDSEGPGGQQQRRLAKRLRVCERELSESKDLLRERTLQLKILMQTVEAVQRSSVAEQHGGGSTDADTAPFDLEDIARAPLGADGAGLPSGNGSGSF